MIFSDFQHLARLHVVGALDAAEQAEFDTGRREFGREAERFLTECRNLHAAFSLSLRPMMPARGARERLMGLIRGAGAEGRPVARAR